MAEALGDTRCSQAYEGDVPVLSTLTGLSARAVLKRVRDSRGNMLLRNAFQDEWPVDAARLGPLTVATARKASLQREIAAVTGLGRRAVGNQIDRTQGKTLLSNAFPELLHEEDDDEGVDDEVGEGDEKDGEGDARAAGSDFRDGRRRFSPVDLLSAVRTVSVRNASPFIRWLAKVLDLPEGSAKRHVRAVHGRTLLRTVFAGRWPPEGLAAVPGEVLGAITSASARRSPSLVRLIADTAEVPAGVAFERLEEAQGNTRVDTVVPELREDPPRKGARPPASAPPPSSPARRGVRRIVDGRYLLGARIASGGFGEVFEATHVHPPHQRVVIKLALPDAPESLKHEIGIAFELSHQNICSYKSYGQDPERGTYLVLQHGGRSLADVLASDGVVDVDRALDLVRQAAAGLDWAHRKTVIHQDVKPGNVLVGDDPAEWEVRVTDFGIALKGVAARNTVGKHTVLATHPRGYSTAYAAPEQRGGGKARKASDQYALALVFCSMLEGREFTKAYEPRRFTRLTSRQHGALMRALSQDPGDRFDWCSEFAAALHGRP